MLNLSQLVIGMILGAAAGIYLFDCLVVRPMNIQTYNKHNAQLDEHFREGRKQGLELAIEKLKNRNV